MKTFPRTHPTTFALAGAIGACLCLTALKAQAAGNMTGPLNAQMLLQAGCTVSGAPNAGSSGVNFGTLDFGAHPSTFTGVLATTASGSVGGAGPTQIVCSPDVTAITIAVSGGNNAGQGGSIGTGSRAMRFGAGYLPYEVYSDAGMTTAFPVNATALGVTLPGTGAAVALPIYGRVNKTSPNAMAAGSYVDVLQVTLAW
jgi:spore coat protein U-like protein